MSLPKGGEIGGISPGSTDFSSRPKLNLLRMTALHYAHGDSCIVRFKFL